MNENWRNVENTGRKGNIECIIILEDTIIQHSHALQGKLDETIAENLYQLENKFDGKMW